MIASGPVVPLEMLQADECGRVTEIAASEEWAHRLKELGLREGVTVRMVRAGEPCIIAVQGHRFTYRCDPATLILVEVG